MFISSSSKVFLFVPLWAISRIHQINYFNTCMPERCKNVWTMFCDNETRLSQRTTGIFFGFFFCFFTCYSFVRDKHFKKKKSDSLKELDIFLFVDLFIRVFIVIKWYFYISDSLKELQKIFIWSWKTDVS